MQCRGGRVAIRKVEFVPVHCDDVQSAHMMTSCLTRALRSSKTQVCEPKMAMKSQCRFRTNMPIEPGATVMFGSIQRGPAVVPAAAASHSAPVTDPFSTPTHNAKDTRNVPGACSGLTQTEVRLGFTGSRNIAKRELQGLAKVCFPGSVNMR